MNSEFSGFGCPEVIFLLLRVFTSSTKYLSLLNSIFKYFVAQLIIHTR
jgi:hypothetical protein